MKKTILLFIITPLLLCSCDDWFDVRPSSQIKENQLFEDESGFQKALIGVYSLLTKDGIYGDECTMSFIEVLAKNYTNSNDYGHYYQDAYNYKYESNRIKPKIDAIWSMHYNAIINVNNILDNIDEKKDILNIESYKIIKGEALALRAFLHFNLLRMFAPSATLGLDNLAIPYADKVSYTPFPQSTFNEVIDKSIKDLNNAKVLLDGADPITKEGYYEDVLRRGRDYETIYQDEGFFVNRRVRMNYYAATGLLARIHLYRGNVEDLDEAAKNASQVINSHIFELQTSDKIAEQSDNESKILSLANEYLFSTYKFDLYDVYEKHFIESGSNNNLMFISNSARDTYFEVSSYGGSADWRNSLFFEKAVGSNKEILAKYKYDYIIPLIKVSEMYYILAEATDNLEILRELRISRGLKKYPDNPDIKEQLKLEYRKEFLGEGQMFFYYKRNNTFPSAATSNEEIFTFPIPENEIEFGDIEN